MTDKQAITTALTDALRDQAKASGGFFNEFIPYDDDGEMGSPLVRIDGAFDLAAVADVLIRCVIGKGED